MATYQRTIARAPFFFWGCCIRAMGSVRRAVLGRRTSPEGSKRAFWSWGLCVEVEEGGVQRVDKGTGRRVAMQPASS